MSMEDQVVQGRDAWAYYTGLSKIYYGQAILLE